MTLDAEDRIKDLLHAVVPVPTRDVTVAQVRDRAVRQSRTRWAVGAVAVAIAAIAVALPLTLGGAAGQRPDESGRPAPGFPASVLGVDATGRVVIEHPGEGHVPKPVNAQIPPNSELQTAADPDGGWILAYSTPPVPPDLIRQERLAWVGIDGHLRPFGPRLDVTKEAITGLAVSPDGSKVAVATFAVTGALPPSVQTPARIIILGTPGHPVFSRSWKLPVHDGNQIRSLSWSPDGKRLAYMAGLQTGAGIASTPRFLHLTKPGHVVPSRGHWPDRAARCEIDAFGWVDSVGNFAALERCLPSSHESFRLVDPMTGKADGPAIRVGRFGCSGSIQAATGAHGVVLVNWCGKVSVIRDGRAVPLPGNLTAAAPAGEPTSPSGRG